MGEGCGRHHGESNRPDCWDDLAPGDRIGRLALLDEAAALRGVAEVREGLTFCLSLPQDYPGGDSFSPGRQPPRLRPTNRRGKPFFLYDMDQEMPGAPDVVNDDAVEITLQYSTHWDALCHIGYKQPDGRVLFFNGVEGGQGISAPDDEGKSGVTTLGIEAMAENCVQGRAVLVDLHAHFGDTYHPVSFTEFEAVMKADNVVVEKATSCFFTPAWRAKSSAWVVNRMRRSSGPVLRPQMARTADCKTGSPTPASPPSLLTITQSSSCRHVVGLAQMIQHFRCMNTVFTASVSTLASSGC